MDPASAAALPAGALSFAGLFLQADPIVKGIMIILALASLACWTIIFDRTIRLARFRGAARAFERNGRTGRLNGQETGPGGRISAAGLAAWRDQDPSESRAERRERYERAMRVALAAEVRRLQPGIPFLATTGSTAPFVGLFGTVWGIMNSFSSIARSQDTSLAVVAPGIAEALFATAIGLVAAIPAVIAFNRLTTGLSRAQQEFSAGITHVGDQLARNQPDEVHDLRKAAE